LQKIASMRIERMLAGGRVCPSNQLVERCYGVGAVGQMMVGLSHCQGLPTHHPNPDLIPAR
jgi:hypothetical protein